MTSVSYATDQQVLDMIKDTSIGSDYNTLITTLALRASRLIDKLTRREVGAYANNTAGTRYFDGNGELSLWVDEMADAPASVAVAESGQVDGAGGTGGTYTTWTVTDYAPWPYNALAQGKPYLRLDVEPLYGDKAYWNRYRKAVKISAKWGYSTTAPVEITEAVITQVVRWWKRGKQGFQDVGAIAALGQLQYVKQLDPDVITIVEAYKRLV